MLEDDDVLGAADVVGPELVLQPAFLFGGFGFDERGVLVELRVEHQEEHAAHPERKVVVAKDVAIAESQGISFFTHGIGTWLCNGFVDGQTNLCSD